MNKYKKLMGNTLVFGVGQVLSKIIGFVLTIIYTHFMPEGELNTAMLIYTTVNLLVPAVTFSMSDAVIRFGMDKGYDHRKVYTCACVYVLGGMALYMLFTPFVSANDKIGSYSFLLYIYCYFSCFRQIASYYVRARGYVKLFMADGVFASFTQLILNLIFIAGLKMGVTGYVLSFIISDALSLAGLTLLADLGKSLHLKYYDKRVAREMLRFSAPLIPTYLLWWITASSDGWLVTYMAGEDVNAVYQVGYKLPTLISLVTTMFYQAWQMSSIDERNSRDLNKFYENVFGAYTSLIFIAAAGLIMLVKPLTWILAGNTPYFDAYLVTPILILSMTFQCFCQFLSSVYTTKKRSINSCVTALAAAAVNIVLNMVLIPEYGMFGAAIATAASYFACFVIRLFDTRRFIFFKVDYLRLLVNTVIGVFMCMMVGYRPRLYVLGIILGFVVCFLFNFDAIIKTLRKILAKR